MSTHDSTTNRDSQAYWNKRATTFTRDATSDYERWLLDLLALEAGEEVHEPQLVVFGRVARERCCAPVPIGSRVPVDCAVVCRHGLALHCAYCYEPHERSCTYNVTQKEALS